MALRESNNHPLGYRTTNGHNMEMALIRVLQDRQAGASVGFSEIERYITSRKEDLIELVKREDEERNQPKT